MHGGTPHEVVASLNEGYEAKILNRDPRSSLTAEMDGDANSGRNGENGAIVQKSAEIINGGDTRTTSRAISKDSKQPHGADQEEWKAMCRRLLVAVCRGGAIGLGLRGGLSAFSLVVVLLKRRKKAAAVNLDKKAGALAAGVGKEVLRYGAFLASFSGLYVVVDELLATIFGRQRSDRWRSAIAGAAAGPCLLLTGAKSKHYSMATYILVRATVLLGRCGLKYESSRRWCAPLGWSHGDVLLTCLSASQILYSWICMPSTLPSSYVHFLNIHGGKPLEVVSTLRHMATHGSKVPLPAPLLADLVGAWAKQGIDAAPRLSPHMAIPCQVIHPGRGCVSHLGSFMRESYGRSLPVYLPVYFVPALIIHRKALLSKPLEILSKALIGTLRSSLFLSLYCALAWGGACTAHQTLGRISGVTLVCSTWLAGTAALVEKKSRRMELALYCLARAAESFALCALRWGWINSKRFPKRFDVVLFSAATAIIMHCYHAERDVFRSKYLNVLDWVFGVAKPATPAKPCENGAGKKAIENGHSEALEK